MTEHVRVYVFFDGGHIRRGLEDMDVPWHDVDLSEVAKVAVKWVGRTWQELPMRVSRILIYDGVADDGDPSQQQVERWLRRNGERKDVHVRPGRLVARPGKPRQKAVDVQLAVDALSWAWNGLFDVALLVTGDGDFTPLAEAIRDRGPLVAVCSFGKKLSDELREVADRVGYLPADPNAWQAWKLPESN